MEGIFIRLFHILIVGSLFLYVGITKSNIPNFMYSILTTIGIIIILYHSYKVYKKLKLELNPWINYIHIFIIGPLLLYIGLNGKKTQRFYFEIVLMLGFTAIGYNGYYLVA
jgi:hypothetical protein